MTNENKQQLLNDINNDEWAFCDRMWCPPLPGTQVGTGKWRHLEYGEVVGDDYDAEETHVFDGQEGWSVSFHDLKPAWWHNKCMQVQHVPEYMWSILAQEWQAYKAGK
jgi:hypothetical protein